MPKPFSQMNAADRAALIKSITSDQRPKPDPSAGHDDGECGPDCRLCWREYVARIQRQHDPETAKAMIALARRARARGRFLRKVHRVLLRAAQREQLDAAIAVTLRAQYERNVAAAARAHEVSVRVVERIAAAIDGYRVPPRGRSVHRERIYQMRDEGMTTRQIADELGISTVAVWKHTQKWKARKAALAATPADRQPEAVERITDGERAVIAELGPAPPVECDDAR